MQPEPRMIDSLKGMETCYEILGNIPKANDVREKIIEVWKSDWGIEQGEIIESVKRRMK